ncbi:MAG: tetratricopeptide repeat protein [Pseudanabaenaceae cyanobacterium bins.68]|nr:tetratricopeptide repeat protein [Pseudanabaenaceae cyanobacterium bins.68]
MPTRIFLCNEREDPEIRQYLQEAEASIAAGEEYLITWSCANVTSVQPGDRAFLKRVGSKPNGYFAAGYVVAAEKRYQLRLQDRRFQNLSAAYDYDSRPGNFVIWLAWDSCVDFELPLRTDLLKRNPQFDGALLDPTAGGGVLRQQYALLLEREWQNHGEEMAKRDRGIRLVDVCIDLGRQNNQQKNHPQAIEYYCRALDVQGDCVKAFVGLGNAYQSLNDHAQAIADYSEALAIGSAYDRVVYGRRGISYYHLQAWQEALLDLERAVQLNPQNSEAHLYRGMTCLKLKQVEAAIASFDQALALDPELDQAFYFRGRGRFYRQEFEAAIADFSAAIHLKPDLIESYYYRGLAYSKLDNGSDFLALQDLRLAAKMYKGRDDLDRYLKVRDLIEVLTPVEPASEELILPAQTPRLLPPETPELKLPDLPPEIVVTANAEPEVSSPRDRLKAAEKQAIDLVIQHYISQGWQVEPAANPRLGFKFSCTQGDQRQDIEIKGLLGQEITFLITSREVSQAKSNPNFVLWVVTACLEQPQLHHWSGAEMLERFQLDPMKYLAILQPDPV